MSYKPLSQLVLSVFCVSGILTSPVFADGNIDQAAGVSAATKEGEKIWADLGLNLEQSTKINKIRIQCSQQANLFRDLIQQKHNELELQLAAPASNMIRLNVLLQEQLALQNSLQKASLDCFMAMKQELTDEQKVALQRKLIAFRNRNLR